MLTESFKLLLANNEKITLAHVECASCTNVFFVPIIGENEPNFCAYCGTKFKFYIKNNDDTKFNLAGFPIKDA